MNPPNFPVHHRLIVYRIPCLRCRKPYSFSVAVRPGDPVPPAPQPSICVQCFCKDFSGESLGTEA